MNKELVEKRWENKIRKATNDLGSTDKDMYVQEVLEEKRKLKLNGGLQLITKFIHVPGLEEDTLPQDV